jgi:hypothetical protein
MKKAAYSITQGIESSIKLLRSRVHPHYVRVVLVADGMTDAQAKSILAWATRSIELDKQADAAAITTHGEVT